MCVVVVYPTSPPTVCGCASVCGVWGDPPTAPSGGDSCHQLTEGDTPSSLSTAVIWREEGGSVDWFVWMVLIEGLLITLPVKVLADGVFLDVNLKVSGSIS